MFEAYRIEGLFNSTNFNSTNFNSTNRVLPSSGSTEELAWCGFDQSSPAPEGGSGGYRADPKERFLTDRVARVLPAGCVVFNERPSYWEWSQRSLSFRERDFVFANSAMLFIFDSWRMNPALPINFILMLLLGIK
jgi:hypothetical protein